MCQLTAVTKDITHVMKEMRKSAMTTALQKGTKETNARIGISMRKLTQPVQILVHVRTAELAGTSDVVACMDTQV